MSGTRPVGKRAGSADGLLKGRDAFGHVTIVYVHRVDLGKALQRRIRLARRFLSYTQIIPQGERAFRIIAWCFQRTLIPDRRNGRLALIHEGQAQKRATLHGIAEGAAAIAGLGDFLEFADGLLEKPHFPKRDAQVVVGFEVFFLRAHFTKLGAKFVENFLEWTGLSRRRGRRRWLRNGRRLGAWHRPRKSWGKLADAELVDLVGKIGQKLIRGKATACRWRWRRILRDRLRRGNRFLGRPLVVRRDERLRFQHELIFLFQFEFRLACLSRFRRRLSRWDLFRLARCRLPRCLPSDWFWLERNGRSWGQRIMFRTNCGFLDNLKLFHVPGLRGTPASGSRLGRHRRRSLSSLSRTRCVQKGRPLIGQINFLNFWLDGDGLDRLGLRLLHGSRLNGLRSRQGGRRSRFGRDFGNRTTHRRWCGNSRGGSFCGGNGNCQFRIRQTSGTLEAAAQFSESFRTAAVACFAVNLFQLCGEFGGAPVVARAKDKVE